jgi:hypothetical protein
MLEAGDFATIGEAPKMKSSSILYGWLTYHMTSQASLIGMAGCPPTAALQDPRYFRETRVGLLSVAPSNLWFSEEKHTQTDEDEYDFIDP